MESLCHRISQCLVIRDPEIDTWLDPCTHVVLYDRYCYNWAALPSEKFTAICVCVASTGNTGFENCISCSGVSLRRNSSGRLDRVRIKKKMCRIFPWRVCFSLRLSRLLRNVQLRKLSSLTKDIMRRYNRMTNIELVNFETSRRLWEIAIYVSELLKWGWLE